MMCIVVFVYSARIIVLCVHVQSTVVPVLSALKVYVILRRNVRATITKLTVFGSLTVCCEQFLCLLYSWLLATRLIDHVHTA